MPGAGYAGDHREPETARAMIDHPDRVSLHNEIHARPRPSLTAPQRVSHVALLRDRDTRHDPAALHKLCIDHGLAPPAAGQRHFFGDLGSYRIKWERHGEFDDYTIYRNGGDAHQPFAEPAIGALPQGWLDALPGKVIAAVHVSVLATQNHSRERSTAASCSVPKSATARARCSPTCVSVRTASPGSCCSTATSRHGRPVARCSD